MSAMEHPMLANSLDEGFLSFFWFLGQFVVRIPKANAKLHLKCGTKTTANG
jgi:hypothetical protein